MDIEKFFETHNVNENERFELIWYLAFFRAMNMVKDLVSE